jgi:hypothetical protein
MTTVCVTNLIPSEVENDAGVAEWAVHDLIRDLITASATRYMATHIDWATLTINAQRNIYPDTDGNTGYLLLTATVHATTTHRAQVPNTGTPTHHAHN